MYLERSNYQLHQSGDMISSNAACECNCIGGSHDLLLTAMIQLTQKYVLFSHVLLLSFIKFIMNGWSFFLPNARFAIYLY